jgi:ElaB/YqjD/DUF883 family membrane-anchored ribosome-binding protein
MSSTDGEDAMKAMTDKATYERLQKDVEAVKNDISALADQISDVIDAFKGDTYKQARANVDTMMADAGKRGSEALDAAQDYAGTLEESLEDAITQRPLAAVGLAVGLGFLIGVTWRR